tara:strand:- start:1267 stop:1554 length:288 start_codon:yes stop_codon:yes gene_type:complete
MKITGKNTWKFENDTWNDCEARVSSTIVEEKTLCDVRIEARKIRFAHEFIHIDNIKQIVKEFDMQIKDAKRRDIENEENLIKEQNHEFESSSNNS